MLLHIKTYLIFLSLITFSISAVPVSCAIHTVRQSEQFGCPILFPTAQLTFYIIVAFFNLFNKMNFIIFNFTYICTFSQKVFSHTTPVLTCADIISMLDLLIRIILGYLRVLTQLTALRGKCPNTEFFLVPIFPYSN